MLMSYPSANVHETLSCACLLLVLAIVENSSTAANFFVYCDCMYFPTDTLNQMWDLGTNYHCQLFHTKWPNILQCWHHSCKCLAINAALYTSSANYEIVVSILNVLL
jgi:hypothetical protein